jgi:RimJ/RimL family protein N-acetyltransferase
MEAPVSDKPESVIETARLLLRPMGLEDVDDLLHIFGDPKVMASFGETPFDRQRMERWVRPNLEHQARYGYGLFSVMHKADDVLIGDCGLEQMEVEGKPVAELGYDFRSDYWGHGYATEAATAVRDYAFDVLHLPLLVSLIRVGNKASIRVAEKVGMQFISELTRFGNQYWEYAIEHEMSRHPSP